MASLAVALLGAALLVNGGESSLRLELMLVATACILPILWTGLRLHSLFQLTLGMLFFTWFVAPVFNPALYSTPEVLRALAYVCGFTVALAIGYHVRHGPDPTRSSHSMAFAWSQQRVDKFVALLLGAAVVGGYIFLRVLGVSISDLYTNALPIRMATTEIGGMYFFRNFVIACLWCAFWLTFISLLYRPRKHSFYRVGSLGVFLFTEVVLFGTGQRFYIFIPFVAGAALLSLRGRKKTSLISLTIALPLLLVLSHIYSVYRTLSMFQGATAGQVIQSLSGSSFSELAAQGTQARGRLSGFATVLAAWDEGRPFLHGKSFLNLPWLVVPQSLFPSKPLYTDSYLTQLLSPHPHTGGSAFASVSELYINFGIFGIVIGGVVFGFLLKIADQYVEANRDRPAVQLWLVTGAIFIPFIVTGGLYSVTTLEMIFFSIFSILLAKALSWKYLSPRAMACAAAKEAAQ